MSEDSQTVPASIWVRFAGDHIRIWKSTPFDEGEEYVHAAAKDAETEQLREALNGLIAILEGFRGTVVLNESRWAQIDRAKALVAAGAAGAPQEPRSEVPRSQTPDNPSGDTR